MMLYTSMPAELVWAGYNEEQQPQQHIEVNAGGILMQVEPLGHGRGKIVRLLHAAIDDYLRPELSPGQIINYANIYSPNE